MLTAASLLLVLALASETCFAVDDDDSELTWEEPNDSTDDGARGRHRRAAAYSNAKLWNKDEAISVFIDKEMPEKGIKAVRDAMQLWQKDTCLQFVENGKTSQKIRFTPGDRCMSNIGKHGDENVISLQSKCYQVSRVAHEMGHALGLLHTQIRFDRDEFIKVYMNSFQNEAAFHASYTVSQNTNSNNFNVPYETSSLMHHRSTDFAKPGAVTAKAIDPNYQDSLGSSAVPTFNDVRMINQMYTCTDKCTGEPKCGNNGYKRTGACDRCICPTGFEGTTCSDMPSETTDLTATSEWKSIGDVVAPSVGSDAHFDTAVWWIRNAEHTTRNLTMKLTSVNTDCTVHCSDAGIEIKAVADKTLTGYRFCCDGERTFTAVGAISPIILYSRHNVTTFDLEFKLA